MTSRIVRSLAMGLCASALALIAASCGSATSPTVPAPAAGGGGTSGGSGGGSGGGTGSGSASPNVTVDFSACPAPLQPLWFAYQDGTGAWTAVTGTNHVYQFSMSQSKGGIAWVETSTTGQTQTAVDYYKQSVLTAAPMVFCPPTGTNSMAGTVAGLVSNQVVNVSMAQGAGSAVYPATNYGITNMVSGSFDLVAWLTGAVGASSGDKVIIRRNVTVQNNGVIPLLDFSSSEAKSAATGTITVTNPGSGSLVAEMAYYTGSSCTGHGLLYFLFNPASSFTAYGVPASLQNPTDFHALNIGLTTGNNYASVLDIFHAMGNRSETFPAPIPQPTMSVLSGSYKREQASLTVPADYNGVVSLVYNDAGAAHSMSLSQTQGYIGGTSVTLATPDFSKLSGFQATWEPATGASTNWIVQASGANYSGPGPCHEGAKVVGDEIHGTN